MQNLLRLNLHIGCIEIRLCTILLNLRKHAEPSHWMYWNQAYILLFRVLSTLNLHIGCIEIDKYVDYQQSEFGWTFTLDVLKLYNGRTFVPARFMLNLHIGCIEINFKIIHINRYKSLNLHIGCIEISTNRFP